MSVQGHAVFSPGRQYRWVLSRTWAPGPLAVFVGVNPSTADEDTDDPTIRRCVRFARDWGHPGICMVNLFPLVSTDPRHLRGYLALPNVAGDLRLNDRFIRECVDRAAVTIACWGATPAARPRGREVLDAGLLGDYRVLRLTRDGHPHHPLRLPATCRPLHPISLEPA